MLDFPSSPVLNQQFSAANSSWVWDGTAWNIVPQMVPAVASDTPPANPAVGQFWWRASNGQLYVFYVDPSGPPGQWVQAAASADVIGEPYPFKTSDTSLRSMSAGVVGLNSKADGSGTSSKMWTDLNNPRGTQYTKLANGFIYAWGSGTTDASGNLVVTWPAGTGFASIAACGGIFNTGGGVAATVAYIVMVNSITTTGCTFAARSISGATVAAAGSSSISWWVTGT